MILLKNRVVIGVLCIITGLLFSFVALPALKGGGQKISVSIVRMKVPVQAGTQITADMLETVNVPENLVAGSIRETSSAIGQYAGTNLYAGDFLTSEKLRAVLAEKDPFSAGTAKGRMVVSITLPSLASGVSGKLLPGDIVTIIALPKNERSLGVEPGTGELLKGVTGAVIYPDLRYIEVCMISANDGADATVNGNPGEEKNSLPVTVSFFASKEQVLRLAELEQQGTIHLVFIARGQASSRYIPDAQRVFNTEVD